MTPALASDLQCLEAVSNPGTTINLQVCANGIVSFRRAFTRNLPQLLRENRSDNFLIAPFWADSDTRLDGQVSYEVHASSDDLVQNVSSFISNRKGNNFTGTWMLLADWSGVHPYPHGSGNSEDINNETLKVINNEVF